jgi:capsular polysaccharide biosynthesis protein
MILTKDDRPRGAPAVLNTVVRQRLEQLRRYLWVVVVVMMSAVAAMAYSLFSAGDSYSAKSALVVSSPGRVPEDDAVLAVGYALLFNDPAIIERLRTARAISDDLDFEASTAAGSPIVTVTATAATPDTAQEAAQVMAEAFRDDMNAARQQESDAIVADLQRQIDELRSRPGPEGLADPAIGPLKESIANVQFYSTTNQLRDLQLRVGVVKNSPRTAVKLLLALIGGLLFGTLCAFALATLSNRLRSPSDVREKTGIEPLVELPRSRSENGELREERLRTLANALNARRTSSPLVLAVTDTRGVHGAQHVAEALAVLSAEQGSRTVLVLTDAEADVESSCGIGPIDALGDRRILGTLLKYGGVDGPIILKAGYADWDGLAPLNPQRLESILGQLRADADLVILAAPSIADKSQAQIICAAADLTLLVIAKRVSRTGDVVSADETLAAVGATVAGAVLLDDNVAGTSQVPMRAPGQSARHRSWVTETVEV